jgi:hypothetical protein
MRKPILEMRRRIRRTEVRRARLIDTLLEAVPLLKGSLSRVMRTCGKPTCHCAKKPGHPVWVLATSVGGLQRCQVIRNADVDTVRQWVATYRGCRTALRQIEAIQKHQKALLYGVMEKRNLLYK